MQCHSLVCFITMQGPPRKTQSNNCQTVRDCVMTMCQLEQCSTVQQKNNHQGHLNCMVARSSPARWAAFEKVLPSLHAGPTVSFYYWDLIFCVRYSVAAPHSGNIQYSGNTQISQLVSINNTFLGKTLNYESTNTNLVLGPEV